MNAMIDGFWVFSHRYRMVEGKFLEFLAGIYLPFEARAGYGRMLSLQGVNVSPDQATCVETPHSGKILLWFLKTQLYLRSEG
jgi:hypothetical protein